MTKAVPQSSSKTSPLLCLKILVEQDLVTDDIQIVSAPPEHRKTYEHASLGLATMEAAVAEKPEHSETVVIESELPE